MKITRVEKKEGIVMPGKHDATKKFMSAAIDRKLWYKLTQYAESIGINRNAMLTQILEDYVTHAGIVLSKQNEDLAEAETQAVRDERAKLWNQKNG